MKTLRIILSVILFALCGVFYVLLQSTINSIGADIVYVSPMDLTFSKESMATLLVILSLAIVALCALISGVTGVISNQERIERHRMQSNQLN